MTSIPASVAVLQSLLSTLLDSLIQQPSYSSLHPALDDISSQVSRSLLEALKSTSGRDSEYKFLVQTNFVQKKAAASGLHSSTTALWDKEKVLCCI
jgi:hypothetical protein